MKSFFRFILLGALLFASGTTLAADTTHWTYEGDEGPEKWAELTPQFAACAGKNQSPINLTGFIEAELEPLRISYQAGGKEILNNGHTVQVNYAAGSSISVDSIPFELMQIHFHAPSENHIDGKSYVMEAHLVHSDKDGNLAVIALMFDEGAENDALAQIWPRVPRKSGEKTALPSLFSAEQLLPSNHDYYRFNGSLTTPPCTEGVRWLVLKETVPVSKMQVDAFMRAIHDHPNNRPLQPVNARPVLQ